MRTEVVWPADRVPDERPSTKTRRPEMVTDQLTVPPFALSVIEVPSHRMVSRLPGGRAAPPGPSTDTDTAGRAGGLVVPGAGAGVCEARVDAGRVVAGERGCAAGFLDVAPGDGPAKELDGSVDDAAAGT